MIGTYAAVLVVCGSSLAIGQAAIALCGAKRWSWLAPAVGLALVCAICWATVRMAGDGVVSAVAILALTVAALLFLRTRLQGGGEALGAGLPVAAGALLATALPFAVEGHFGILGTGFNPDMSQHLLATDRLAHGAGSQLLNQGYPLGPHAVVVALEKGLGVGLVQGFTGLTVAAAILAPLTALTAFSGQPPLRRTAMALVVGLAYLVASYFAQGAFKETIQALLVLAFVLALREASRSWSDFPLRFVPAAIVAIGSVYVYSFPGLIWLVAILAIWLVLERALPVRPLLLGLVVFGIGVLPELGRMIDFKQFETFDPSGPGLGNLFGQISPFTALGIWPSGDFRVAAGDGAVPAVAYYLGAAFAMVLLIYGMLQAWRMRERAVIAGLMAVVGLYAAARLGGTAYTSAKALEIAAPVLTLAILSPLSWRSASPAGGAVAGVPHSGGDREAGSEHMGEGRHDRTRGPRQSSPAPTGPAGLVLVVYALAAGACSLLAFANVPIGPTSYSPALNGLRPLLAEDSTLVLAPDSLLADEQGERYVVWELRGGRVCVEPEGSAGGQPPAGVRFVVTEDSSGQPPFDRLVLRERAGPYVVWERRPAPTGVGPCPLIAVRQARQGP